MPPNKEPVFALTPNCPTASLGTTPNTASDGSGTLIDLFTAGANGSRVDEIRFINAQAAPALSSAMLGKMFITDSAGANPRYHDEVAIAAATRAAGTVGAKQTIAFPGGLHLAAGQKIKVCQSVYAGVQDLMHATARGGDF